MMHRHYNLFNAGDIVRLTRRLLNDDAGTLAYVFEVFSYNNHQYVSLVTENGNIQPYISILEQIEYLQYVDSTGEEYRPFGSNSLTKDLQNGYFQKYFKAAA